jgi:hypothetical protein
VSVTQQDGRTDHLTPFCDCAKLKWPLLAHFRHIQLPFIIVIIIIVIIIIVIIDYVYCYSQYETKYLFVRPAIFVSAHFLYWHCYNRLCPCLHLCMLLLVELQSSACRTALSFHFLLYTSLITLFNLLPRHSMSRPRSDWTLLSQCVLIPNPHPLGIYDQTLCIFCRCTTYCFYLPLNAIIITITVPSAAITIAATALPPIHKFVSRFFLLILPNSCMRVSSIINRG